MNDGCAGNLNKITFSSEPVIDGTVPPDNDPPQPMGDSSVEVWQWLACCFSSSSLYLTAANR